MCTPLPASFDDCSDLYKMHMPIKSFKSGGTLYVDKACNGCSPHVKYQNLWHLITRAYTVWCILNHAHTRPKQVSFSRNRIKGNVSKQVWEVAVSNNNTNSDSEYDIHVQQNLAPPRGDAHFAKFSLENMPDTLWSLSKIKKEMHWN